MEFLQHWLRPGMTVIDIGANLGVYSILMARLVGRNGHVFAYEPGSETRSFLARSRELNAVENLVVSPLALSDRRRDGFLVFGSSSELNALGDCGSGEPVRIASLDEEDAIRGWSSPDFIKIDAEGEEERILAGGRDFFTKHSPLIMFEIKAENKMNENLRLLFPKMGYRLFRQLGDAPILLNVDAQEPLDPYELNLFAAKPDRVGLLSEQGFLVDAVSHWSPDLIDQTIVKRFCQTMESLAPIKSGAGTRADSEYSDCLAAYAMWRYADQPLERRVAALAFALKGLRALCSRAPTAERLSSLARVAWEFGARAESVAALQRLLQSAQKIQIGEPFLPVHSHFDNMILSEERNNSFISAVAEQFERSSNFSSMFGGGSGVLPWLCTQPFVGIEMERRRVLCLARAGQRPAVPPRLCKLHSGHRNADIWRSGKVPGTSIGPSKSGRNEPCSCGSGKKYKHCCGSHA